MPTSSMNFANLSVGNLLFTNILVNETDIGTVTPFLTSAPFEVPYVDGFGQSGINFAAFNAGVTGRNSSETLVFTYNVGSNDPTKLIGSLSASYQIDLFSGPNAALNDTFTAVEQAFDSHGNLLASQTITASSANTAPIYFTQAQASITVKLTVTMAVGSGGNATSAVDISGIQQNFGTVDSSQLCSIGDIVFLDSDRDGLENAGFDAGPGVAGVTVQLLNSTGTTVLATTTTGADGRYSFNNLLAGTYEVKFVTSAGYTFTTQGVGTNAGINSSANQTTGITGPITLTAGQANHNVEAGLVVSATGGGGGSSGGGNSGGITILKVPSAVVVNGYNQLTYTFYVTNNGTSTIKTVSVVDNIGTAQTPVNVTAQAVTGCGGYNIGDTNHNGQLNAGETWQYTASIKMPSVTASSSSGGHDGSGGDSRSTGSSSDSRDDSHGSGSDCGPGGTSGAQVIAVADTATVTATSKTGAIFTATDTKVVQVIASSGRSYGSEDDHGGGSSSGSSSSDDGHGGSCSSGSSGSGDDHSGASSRNTTRPTAVAGSTTTSSGPITVDGCAPTGSLSALFGTGDKIEFAYNPSNTVSLKQVQAGLASATGHAGPSMAFIEISNSSNPFASGAQIYFEGNVQAGEKIFADATINSLTNSAVTGAAAHFDTTAGSDIYAYVFTSQATFAAHQAPLQTMAYNTSSSQAMHFGDQIGSLTVVGYLGANGGHLVT